ncbi:MAG: hypothetical protein ACLFQV_10045 [Vulcanimicrobiota bacterium]
MTLEAYNFSHIVIIVILIGVVLLLKRGLEKPHKLVVKYSMATLSGATVALIISYLLAHLVTTIVRNSQFNPLAASEMGYSFMFWALFVGFGLIGIIAGGLGGMLFLKKQGQSEPNRQTGYENPQKVQEDIIENDDSASHIDNPEEFDSPSSSED